MTKNERNDLLGDAIENGLHRMTNEWLNDDIPAKVVADAMLSTAATISVNEIGQQQTAKWFHGIAEAIWSGEILIDSVKPTIH
ncbi:MAG: hypothetical protein ABW146_17255 [Candidatus Sedimenticola sp. 6PFRAG7]